MNRRGFISMMVGAAGALVLPKWRIPDPVIVLPPRDFTTADMRYSAYFTSKYSWFIKTGHPDGIALTSIEHPFSNSVATPVDLSEAAIERLVIDIRRLQVDSGGLLALRTTRFVA